MLREIVAGHGRERRGEERSEEERRGEERRGEERRGEERRGEERRGEERKGEERRGEKRRRGKRRGEETKGESTESRQPVIAAWHTISFFLVLSSFYRHLDVTDRLGVFGLFLHSDWYRLCQAPEVPHPAPPRPTGALFTDQL